MNRDHRGGGRQRRDERSSEFKETVVKINRCSKVVKGGRRFSFSCLSVVGDEEGKVAIGYGKASDVPSAIQKAMKVGRAELAPVPVVGDSIPHEVIGVFGSSRVLLKPARPGTGIIAGSSVRAVVEAVGIKNLLTKSFGSNNPINLTKATLAGLHKLRSKEMVEQLRGVQIEEIAS